MTSRFRDGYSSYDYLYDIFWLVLYDCIGVYGDFLSANWRREKNLNSFIETVFHAVTTYLSSLVFNVVTNFILLNGCTYP